MLHSLGHWPRFRGSSDLSAKARGRADTVATVAYPRHAPLASCSFQEGASCVTEFGCPTLCSTH
eukprot:1455384-Pyramimonas_sp.AAC.1